MWEKKEKADTQKSDISEVDTVHTATMLTTVDRLPVEIWRSIIQYACATSFSPFVDDYHNHLSSSITQNFDLFKTGSVPPHQPYREGNAILKELRLVCRLWTQIIDLMPSRYIFTNLEDFTYPLVQLQRPLVIETVHLSMFGLYSSHCFCPTYSDKCLGRNCMTNHTSPKSKKFWAESDILLQERLHNVKIVFLRGLVPNPDKLPKAAPNTRALCCTNLPHRQRIWFFSTMRHLTHLALNQITCLQFLEGNPDRPLVFPAVRYLELFFVRNMAPTGWASSGRKAPLFPNLRTLKVDGDIEPSYEDMIRDFLVDCGQRLVEFIEYANYSTSKLRGIPRMLPTLSLNFPNLQLYGTLLDEFLSHTESPEDPSSISYAPGGSSFTLLLYDFIEKFKQTPEEASRRLQIVITQFRVTRIMIKESWTDLGTHLERLPTPRRRRECLNLFKTFIKSINPPVEFVDREGLYFHNATFLYENF
jgi:hypothetical protein